jgi:hypothetical protein
VLGLEQHLGQVRNTLGRLVLGFDLFLSQLPWFPHRRRAHGPFKVIDLSEEQL